MSWRRPFPEYGINSTDIKRVFSPPPGFTLNHLPMPEIAERDGKYSVLNIDEMIKALYPARGTGRAVWVSPNRYANGDGNGPLTPTTVAKAVALPEVDTLYFLPGEYRREASSTWATLTRNMSYIGVGNGVLLTSWNADIAWTLDGPNIYRGTRAGIGAVLDIRPRYAATAPYQYEQVGSTAAIVSPGQWYTDGTIVWVRMIDDSDLSADASLIRLSTNVSMGIQHSNSIAYAENLTICAGQSSGLNAVNSTFILRDVAAIGFTANGLNALNSRILAIDCEASSNGADGFNYHETFDAVGSTEFIEINCKAVNNGVHGGATHNASTGHEASRGIRIGGYYSGGSGPILADVNSCQTWTLGATVERTDSKTGAHIRTSGSPVITTPSKMYVENATLKGTGTAYHPDLGGVIYARNVRATTPVMFAGDGLAVPF